MSAVRMVAYGVLVLPELDRVPDIYDQEVADRRNKQMEERAELRKLVREELREHDMFLQSHVDQKGAGRFRTSQSRHDLYGKREGSKALPTRKLIGENLTLQEACIAALRILEPDNKHLEEPKQARGPDAAQ